jgi:hypothetical protein
MLNNLHWQIHFNQMFNKDFFSIKSKFWLIIGQKDKTNLLNENHFIHFDFEKIFIEFSSSFFPKWQRIFFPRRISFIFWSIKKAQTSFLFLIRTRKYLNIHFQRKKRKTRRRRFSLMHNFIERFDWGVRQFSWSFEIFHVSVIYIDQFKTSELTEIWERSEKPRRGNLKA